jgi:hypothetical protein
MTERGRELLPPEEATSWDEFQDRWVIERARYQGTGRTWRETGRLWLSVLPGLAAVVFWVAFALSGHGVRWLLLALALICTALFGWALGGVLLRRWRRARKRRDLDRLRDQWHERSERGDLPRTSPGGSKVWRDEIPVEVPEDKRTSLSKQRRGPDHPERLGPGPEFNFRIEINRGRARPDPNSPLASYLYPPNVRPPRAASRPSARRPAGPV